MEIHEDKIGWDIQLAKRLKDLTDRGQQTIGANVGVVISKSPLSIKLYDGNLIIQSNVHEMYLSSRLNYHSKWGVGDSVLVVADNDNEVFFVVDVVTRVGG